MPDTTTGGFFRRQLDQQRIGKLFAGFSGIDAHHNHLLCVGGVNIFNQLPRSGKSKQAEGTPLCSCLQPLSGLTSVALRKQPFHLQLKFTLLDFVGSGEFNFTSARGVTRIIRVLAGGNRVSSLGHIAVFNPVLFGDERAVLQPDADSPRELSGHGGSFQLNPAIWKPFALDARAVFYLERAKQFAALVPLPAKTMQPATLVKLFGRHPAIGMPGATFPMKLMTEK